MKKPYSGIISYLIFLIAVLYFTNISAYSQNMTNSFSGFSQNSDEPIQIEANQLDIYDKENKAIFSGNVVVVQGVTTMKTKLLKVFYQNRTGKVVPNQNNNKNKSIKRLEASGGVVVVTSTDNQAASADFATFKMATQMIIMCGSVVVSQGKNIMKGEQLEVNLETRESRFVANNNCKVSKDGGRVKGILFPQSKPSN